MPNMNDGNNWPYVFVGQTNGDYLVDWMMHSQPCYCSRCRNLIHEAAAVAELLAPGQSETILSDGCDGIMHMTLTRRGPEKPSVPKPRPAQRASPRVVNPRQVHPQFQQPPPRPQPHPRQQIEPDNFGDYLRGSVFTWATDEARKTGKPA